MPLPEDRAAAMEKLGEQVRNLTRSPLYGFRTEHNYKAVIGEGDLNAKIMLIGEAPGLQEAKSGRPFVGASGRFLNELLESAGLQREQVYITNIVKDRPPENRDPTPDEIALYAPVLEAQIALIQPQVIATLGRFAMDYVLGLFQMPQKGEKISLLHGQLLEAQAPYGSVYVLPLYHPAVALYNLNQRQTLLEDIQKLAPFV
jgi:DNA polymerase